VHVRVTGPGGQVDAFDVMGGLLGSGILGHKQYADLPAGEYHIDVTVDTVGVLVSETATANW
jgi:hypothetical protein